MENPTLNEEAKLLLYELEQLLQTACMQKKSLLLAKNNPDNFNSAKIGRIINLYSSQSQSLPELQLKFQQLKRTLGFKTELAIVKKIHGHLIKLPIIYNQIISLAKNFRFE